MWLLQSVLFGLKGGIDFYLVKNIFLVFLQAIVFYLNTLFLIPHLFEKNRYVIYILSGLLMIYFAYIATWPFVNIMFLVIYPDVVVIRNDTSSWLLPTDFWRIFSGSVFYFIAVLSGTVLHLISQRNKQISGKPEIMDSGLREIETVLIKEGKKLINFQWKKSFLLKE